MIERERRRDSGGTEARRKRSRGAGGLLPIAIAAVALALALPAGASGARVEVIRDGSTILFTGNTDSDWIDVADVNDPGCPGGPPCYRLRHYGGSVTAAAPCELVGSEGNKTIVHCPRMGSPQFAIGSIRVVTRAGNDSIVINEFLFGLTVRHTSLYGGPGDDFLTGGQGRDTLGGQAGADRLNGRQGDDSLRGDEGPDTLDGARGRDGVIGGRGADRLLGGTERDILTGGYGRDLLKGQQGRDQCYGGRQKDRARNCEFRRSIP